jgi:hypothetical protein
MHLPFLLPLIYEDRPPRGKDTKTILSFINVELEIEVVGREQVETVAEIFADQRNGDGVRYVMFDGKLYSAMTKGRMDNWQEASTFATRVTRSVTGHLNSWVRAEILSRNQTDLYPKNAKDWVKEHASGMGIDDGWEQAVHDFMKAQKVLGTNIDSEKFQEGARRAISLAADKLQEFISIDGVVYAISTPPVWEVNLNYNGHVKVEPKRSTSDIWCNPLGVGKFSFDLNNTFLFGPNERELATDFANEKAAELQSRIWNGDTSLKASLVCPQPELFDNVNWRWAEFVRLSKELTHAVGREIARRIKNQEESLFTDDKKLRYAFDRVADVLEAVDPFGVADDRLQEAMHAMLEVIKRDEAGINERMRNLTEKYAKKFDRFETALL